MGPSTKRLNQPAHKPANERTAPDGPRGRFVRFSRSRRSQGARDRVIPMFRRVAILAGAGLMVTIGGACSSGTNLTTQESITSTTQQETTTTTLDPTELAAHVDAFGEWYRIAVAEGGDELDPRFAADNPDAPEYFASLIRILCPMAMAADDSDRLRAAGETIKDDPEWFGDAQFARSGILMARTACGLG